jgi:hypothetical protein
MKYRIYLFLLILAVCLSCNDISKIQLPVSDNQMKYPCPVIAVNSHANAWSATPLLYGEHLQDDKKQVRPIVGMIRVDGKVYHFMGSSKLPDRMIAGMSYEEKWEGKYTFIRPSGNWQTIDYDDSNWDSGHAPFGTSKYHSKYYKQINTFWQTPEIWVRRKVKIDENELANKKLYLKYSHDDVFELYINGILVVQTGFEWGENKQIEISDEVKATFHTGEMIVAVNGKNQYGDGLLDFGIYIKQNVGDEWEGRYTFSQPETGWENKPFDDTAWSTGKAPFGTPQDYSVNTIWNTPKIWIRREITVCPEDLENTLFVDYSHDDVFDLYVNGIQLVKTGFEWNEDQSIMIPDSLKTHKLLIAAHCRNLSGGALADFNVRSESVAIQKSVEVQATQTHYRFECGQVELKLDFTAPLLPSDIEILFRPINYISYEIVSLDSQAHDVSIYFEISPGWVSDDKKQDYTTKLYENNDLLFVKTGRKEQQLFEYDEDDNTPLWGYFFFCSGKLNTFAAMGDPAELRKEFAENAKLSFNKQTGYQNYIALSKLAGKITKVHDKIMLGYDDIYSLQYFGKNIFPVWNRNKPVEQLFKKADRDYDRVLKACNDLDKNLAHTQNGFDYRQMLISCRLITDETDEFMIFTQNGISDILRSSSLFLSVNKRLLKAQLTPLLLYCESDKWEKEYAPSNMGDDLLFNGQINAMLSPVETTSDMLFLLSMITAVDGNTDYVQKHWLTITQWNTFLQKNQGNPNFSEAVNRGIIAYNYMKKNLKKILNSTIYQF